MTKRQKYLSVFTLFFFLAGLGFEYYIQHSVNVEQYAFEIEDYLHENEKKLEDLFADKEFIVRQLSREKNEEDFERLQSLFQEDFTFCIFQEDSLAFWTKNEIAPDELLLEKEAANLTYYYLQLSNGHYEILKKSFIDSVVGKYTLFGFIPIKYEYALESSYLQNTFKANSSIPTAIKVSGVPSAVTLSNRKGEPLCYLTSTSKFEDPIKQRILFALFLLSFLFLGILVNNVAKKIAIVKPPWWGFAFLVIVVFGVRFITMELDLTGKFESILLFKQDFNTTSYLGKSLGDLVINILLWLWVMVFFHREFRVKPIKNLGFAGRFGLSSLYYLAIIMGILMISKVFQQLVFSTNITFDFEHIFNLNRYSFVAITASLLLLVALYLFSHRIMDSILHLGMRKAYRIGALILASLIAIPIIQQTTPELPVSQMVLIGFMFNMIFDIYVDNNKPSFIWLVIWLVVFALIPSILLFKYNNDMDVERRLSYAKKLSDLKDDVAESNLVALKKDIWADKKIRQALLPYPFQSPAEDVVKEIENHFTNNNYLYNNYAYDIFAYFPDADSISQGSALIGKGFPKNEIKAKLAESLASPTEGLKYLNQANGENSYILNFDVPANNDIKTPVTIFMEITRNQRDQSKVFTELLIEEQFKNLGHLNDYEYAIFDGDQQLIYKEGKSFNNTYPFDVLPSANDTHLDKVVNNWSYLIYKGAGNNIVVISQKLPTARRIVSLFAFLFILLVLVTLLLVIFNSFLKILPNTFNFTFEKVWSLRTRIQLAVIALTVIFFFSIGFVTVSYFSDERGNYHEARLERKGNSIMTDFDLSINEYYQTEQNENVDFQKIVDRISKIHRMDVNIYNTNGKLISSSEKDIFEKGIISRSMDALAFNAISKMGYTSYTQENEKVGTLQYKAAYMPLQLHSGEVRKTIAYMGLPYYSKQRELRDDVNVFMGQLLNVYVFLLLIAGVIAIGITNSITRPIARIGEKLKEFKLGKRNEPLEWKSNDELGDLIEEYNRLIEKVEESAEKLAHQEREGAWREMAKQVAHEIKNPLTPMKLSIQYLLHAYRSNPEDIAPLLKRVSGTLIEQIDNLAAIASEFSNFAKMPRAENQKLLVNDLVQSVYDFFNEGAELVDLNLEMPNQQFFIFADKNHLISVLNNLIKNATQAIPDDRRGVIVVSLFQNANNKAVIRVKDNGTGIPEDKWNKVFVPNFTTKSSGTGLGLAISKNIIESVDGKIYFKTVMDQGTEFFVELPIVEVKELEEA